MMLMAAAKVVQLSSYSHTRISFSPSNANAGFRVNSDGTLDGTAATNLNWALDDGTWLIAGANSDYEVQFTKQSGPDPDSGTLTTWQGLGTSRSISYTQTGIGNKTGVFTVKIRHASTLAVLDTGTVSLTAIVE